MRINFLAILFIYTTLIISSCNIFELEDPTDIYPVYAHGCKAFEKVPIKGQDGDTFVVNNIFNKPEDLNDYKQCITVDQESDNPVIVWSWSWPSTNSEEVTLDSSNVLAFPEIRKGHKPWDKAPDKTEFPVFINEFQAEVDFDITIEAEGAYNLSFDLWCSVDNTPEVNDISYEIMIWLANSSIVPYGEVIDTVNIDGNEYELWFEEGHGDLTGGTEHTWTYYAFIAKETAEQDNINLGLFTKYLLNRNLVIEETYVDSIELGSQIIFGEGSVEISNLSIKM